MRFFVALLAAGTTFAAPVAFACDCGGQTLPQAMKTSDAVFTAKAEDVSTDRWGEARLRVVRVFKGKPGKDVAMIGTGGNCTFRFVKGETYLVFARAMPNARHQTSICTRTAKVEDAQAKSDIAELTGF